MNFVKAAASSAMLASRIRDSEARTLTDIVCACDIAKLSRFIWRDYAVAAGFESIRHYHRPDGLPREEQRWLASLWRR